MAMIYLNCGGSCHPKAKSPYCLKEECRLARVAQNSQRYRDKRRGGPAKARPSNRNGWHRTRIATGRTCGICHHEIYQIKDHSGVVIFDNRFTCHGCTGRRHELEDKANMEWVLWV